MASSRPPCVNSSIPREGFTYGSAILLGMHTRAGPWPCRNYLSANYDLNPFAFRRCALLFGIQQMLYPGNAALVVFMDVAI